MVLIGTPYPDLPGPLDAIANFIATTANTVASARRADGAALTRHARAHPSRIPPATIGQFSCREPMRVLARRWATMTTDERAEWQHMPAENVCASAVHFWIASGSMAIVPQPALMAGQTFHTMPAATGRTGAITITYELGDWPHVLTVVLMRLPLRGTANSRQLVVEMPPMPQPGPHSFTDTPPDDGEYRYAARIIYDDGTISHRETEPPAE